MTPKIIYQAWIGMSAVPEQLMEWHKKWQQLNPDWEVKLLLDEDIPFLKTYLIYDKVDIRGKSNILRYELLKKTGGVWIDLDVEPIKTIPSNLFGNKPTISTRNKENELCNAVMSAPTNSIWMTKVLKNLPQRYITHAGEHSTISTGSSYLKDMMTTDNEDVILLSNDLFIPFDYDGKGDITEDTIAIHHFSTSGA